MGVIWGTTTSGAAMRGQCSCTPGTAGLMPGSMLLQRVVEQTSHTHQKWVNKLYFKIDYILLLRNYLFINSQF